MRLTRASRGAIDCACVCVCMRCMYIGIHTQKYIVYTAQTHTHSARIPLRRSRVNFAHSLFMLRVGVCASVCLAVCLAVCFGVCLGVCIAARCHSKSGEPEILSAPNASLALPQRQAANCFKEFSRANFGNIFHSYQFSDASVLSDTYTSVYMCNVYA